MSVRDLLETGGLRAAASWLLREHRADLSGAPEILRVLETAASAPDVRPLASVVAAYLLLSGDQEAARRAYSLGLGPEAQGRVIDSCELVAEPAQCYELRSLPAEADRVYQTRSGESLRIARLEQARVYGMTFLPVTADVKACAKRFVHNSNHVQKILYYAEGQETFPVATDSALLGSFSGCDDFGAAVLIGNIDNIGHWLLNHLARLALVEPMPELKGLPLVVGENISARQLECLERFGYPPSRLIRLRKGRLARFDELWAPMMLYCAEGWSPAVLDFLRRGFGVTERRSGGRGRRLYLTRRNSRWRRLLNEDAIAGLLAQRGFEVADPGALSMADQVRLAAGAEAIVGIYGGAMTLMMFAPRGTRVIELQYQRADMNEVNVTPSFCHQLGQPYQVVLGIPQVSGTNPLDYDFTLAPELLERALDSAGIR